MHRRHCHADLPDLWCHFNDGHLRKIYCFNYGLCAYYPANLSETRNTQDCLQ